MSNLRGPAAKNLVLFEKLGADFASELLAGPLKSLKPEEVLEVGDAVGDFLGSLFHRHVGMGFTQYCGRVREENNLDI
jgi:hypothetical protein